MALVSAGASLGGFAGGSVLSRLLVVVSGDTRSLTTALRTAQSDVLTFSQKASVVGNSLTRMVSLPAIAAAGSMIFLNAQFQKSIATIAGLTPVVQNGEETIESLNKKILDLAQTLPTSPNEIAKSFYFAASAGLKADVAFQIVEMSAKGAAIGMGEAADISRVLIAALNNYGDAGLTAQSAMDALTAAIREGTAEPDELAVALGRLLPIAEQAGVSFDEVVGSVAALTNLGVPARVATTSLRALFSQLLAPTKQATDTLNQLGLTAGDVRLALEQGPIFAFQLLWNAARGNEDIIRDLIPQIRGLTAYYGATGDQLDNYRRILDATSASQGDFNRAFAEIKKTSAFQFEVGINKLRVAAIELGAKMIPVFDQIIVVVQSLADILIKMPSLGKGVLAGLLLMAGAAGPLTKLAAVLTEVRTVQIAGSASAALSVSTWRALGTQFLTTALAGAVAVGSMRSLANGAGDFTTVAITAISSTIALYSALRILQNVAAAFAARGATGIIASFATLGGPVVTGAAIAIAAVGTAIAWMAGQGDRLNVVTKQMTEGLLTAARSGETFEQALDNIDDEKLRSAVYNLAKAQGLLRTPVGEGLAEGLGSVGEDLAANLRQLEGVTGIFGPMDLNEFKKGLDLVEDAVASGQDWGKVLRDANIDTDAFGEMLTVIADARADTSIGAAAAAASAALPVFNSLRDSLAAYNREAQNRIILSQADAQATTAYAKELGVSTEFLQSELDRVGVSAAGMSEETKQAFEQMLTYGKKGTAAQIEQAKAAQAAFGELTKTLTEGFNLFGDLPEKASKSLETYLNRAEELSRVAIQQTQDIEALQAAGVPAGLIDQLIAAGPSMLTKFAHGTKGQLDDLVAAYEIGLAAIDSSILEEADHQERKGRGMVQGFANAILGSKHLTDAAAQELLYSIGTKISQGDLSSRATRLLTTFIRGMERGPQLASEQARAVIVAFANELSKPKNFDGYGNLMVQQVVNGIAANVDLPKQRIATMVDNALNSVVNKEPQAQRSGQGLAMAAARGLESVQFVSIGQSFAAQVAEGMSSMGWVVAAAATTLATTMKTAFDDALHGSPRYASFYMGQKWNEEFSAGMKSRRLTNSRPVTMMGPGTRGHDGGDETTRLAQAIARGLGEGMGDVVVSIDGAEIARAQRRDRVRLYG